MSSGDPTTYREAYATLSRIAAELENGDADLDEVLPLLEVAREAYAHCRQRIEAVRSVLQSDWDDPEDPGSDLDGEDGEEDAADIE